MEKQTNFSSTFSGYTDSISVFKSTALWILSLGTIFGNSLVILAVFYSKIVKKRFPAFLIMNLALADVLVGMTVIPISTILTAADPIDPWSPLGTLCKILNRLHILFAAGSIFSLCAIAIDRYIGITRPIYYVRIMSSPNTNCGLITTVWLLAIIVCSGPTFIWPFDFDPECNQNYNYKPAVSTYFIAWYSVIVVIICVLYWRIFKALAKREAAAADAAASASDSQESANSPMRQQISLRIHIGGSGTMITSDRLSLTSSATELKSQRRIATMLALIVGIFIICWLPYFLILLINVFGVEFRIKHDLTNVLACIGHFNSCLNPFIYAANSKSFKVAFRDLWACKRSRYSSKAECI